VTDPVDAPSAIVGLRAAGGQDVTAVRTRLLAEHGIVTTACTVLRAPLDMAEPLLRISPHVDVTADDLTRLRQALLTLT
jgi:hercynylcysteine S-oxide lyase